MANPTRSQGVFSSYEPLFSPSPSVPTPSANASGSAMPTSSTSAPPTPPNPFPPSPHRSNAASKVQADPGATDPPTDGPAVVYIQDLPEWQTQLDWIVVGDEVRYEDVLQEAQRLAEGVGARVATDGADELAAALAGLHLHPAPSPPAVDSAPSPLTPLSDSSASPNDALSTPVSAAALQGRLQALSTEPSRSSSPAISTSAPTPCPAEVISGKRMHRRKQKQKRNVRKQREVHLFKLRASHLRHCKAVQLKLRFDPHKLPHAASTFVGLTGVEGDLTVENVEALKAKKYLYRAWDGRRALAICARNGRILMVLHGRPVDVDGAWDRDCAQVEEQLAEAARILKLGPVVEQHRRGYYPNLTAGFSMGNGAKRPHNFDTRSKTRGKVIRDLLDSSAIRRIAGYQDACFATMAPKLYREYRQTALKILEKHPELNLRMPYPNSVFAATTFNIGGQVWTVPHADASNLPYGWCLITALGRFNSQRSGHLVLHTFKLIVEFPPHSTISLPSGSVVHSNIPVREDGWRCSITQYTAGSLFRWAAYDYRLADDLKATNPAKFAELQHTQEQRWRDSIQLLSLYDELLSDVEEVYGPSWA